MSRYEKRPSWLPEAAVMIGYYWFYKSGNPDHFPTIYAATTSGNTVGVAEFAPVFEYHHDPYVNEEYEQDDPWRTLVALKGWQVAVHPDHRRKGVASAMYRFAEQTFGLSIQPGDFQTPDGGAFLKGRK